MTGVRQATLTASSSPHLPPPSPASRSPRTGQTLRRRASRRQPPRPVAKQPVDPAGRPGPPEDALAAIEEAVTIRRQLAAARPDAFRPDLASSLTSLFADLAARQPDDYLNELEQSLQVAAWFERSEDLSDTSPQEQEPKA